MFSQLPHKDLLGPNFIVMIRNTDELMMQDSTYMLLHLRVNNMEVVVAAY